MRDDDPQVTCGVVPINPFPWQKGEPPEPVTHSEVFLEITSQLIEFLEAALKERDDPDKPLRIIAQAENLMGTYTSEGFFLLEQIQRDLQDTLHTAWRMARRQFIRKALRCQPYETETYIQHFRELGWRGAEAMEDFHAVESALAEGRSIFEDLRRAHRSRVVG
jgi:hypothetical protein